MSVLNTIISSQNNLDQTSFNSSANSAPKTTQSFIEIPADLLQKAIQTCESKTELVVFLTIARFSLGFNRQGCAASRRFIAQWTGLKYQNVGRGVDGLIKKGLIEKLPGSNAKLGDSFKILTADFKENEASECNQTDYTKTPECNQFENTQGVINLITDSNQIDYGPSSKRLRSVISLITKNKKEEEDSSSVPEKIQKYLENLPEFHLRKIETKSFERLRTRFNSPQIELAFEFILREGTSSGERVRLPLAYLVAGTSMENVLSQVERNRLNEEKKSHSQLAAVQIHREDRERDRLSKLREDQAQKAFEIAFPTEGSQQSYIADFLSRNFKSIKPSGKIAKKLAIHQWFTNAQAKK